MAGQSADTRVFVLSDERALPMALASYCSAEQLGLRPTLVASSRAAYVHAVGQGANATLHDVASGNQTRTYHNQTHTYHNIFESEGMRLSWLKFFVAAQLAASLPLGTRMVLSDADVVWLPSARAVLERACAPDANGTRFDAAFMDQQNSGYPALANSGLILSCGTPSARAFWSRIAARLGGGQARSGPTGHAHGTWRMAPHTTTRSRNSTARVSHRCQRARPPSERPWRPWSGG